MPQQSQETVPRARGRWTKNTTTVQHLAGEDIVEVHTFHAESGYAAVMTRVLGGRRKPYTAEVRTPTGGVASRTNEHGHRMAGMEMHLKQRDARFTIEEAVHEIERQAAAQAEQTGQ